MYRAFLVIILMTPSFPLFSQGSAENSKHLLKKIDSYINAGRLDGAEKLLRSAVKDHPDDLELLSKYGSVLIQKGDSTGTWHLNKVVTRDPDHLFAHKELGRHYLMKGVQTNFLIERAESSNAEELESIKKKRDGQLQKMIHHYEHVIRLEPKDQLTLTALMNVYSLLEDKENYNKVVLKLEALKNNH